MPVDVHLWLKKHYIQSSQETFIAVLRSGRQFYIMRPRFFEAVALCPPIARLISRGHWKKVAIGEGLKDAQLYEDKAGSSAWAGRHRRRA